jgi:hypothetical protein
MSEMVLDERMSGEVSVTSNKTSASRRLAGSLAGETHFAEERKNFNDVLSQVKD